MNARWISRLRLTSFRSYPLAEVNAGSHPVVLVGPNGIGKTNLLEAVSLLVPGRGLRGAPFSELASVVRDEGAVSLRTDAGKAESGKGWAVAARLERPQGPLDIGTGVTPPALERRQVRINGEATTAVELAQHLSALWLTPAMDRLFAEGASGRRRFFDRLVLALYPDHAGHVARFEAAMRQRGRLLEERAPDPAWLDALERRMAEHGVAVAAARQEALAALRELIQAQPEGPFPQSLIALDGAVEEALEGAKALDVEDWLAQELKARRSADQASGRAGLGVHRTDLMVTHAPKAMPADRCSTGEQKALLIGLILAQARLIANQSGHWPILLLDEVAAHLDATRRAGLFDILVKMGVQAWMTGTDASLFDALGTDAQIMTIEAGRPVPLNS